MMVSKKKMEELGIEILQEIYAACTPPLDFKEHLKKVKETGVCEEKWFLKHEISEEDYIRIVTNFYKKHKLNKRERKAFEWHLLDYAPKTMRD